MQSTYISVFKTILGPWHILPKLFEGKFKHQFFIANFIQEKKRRKVRKLTERKLTKSNGKLKIQGQTVRMSASSDHLNCLIWTLPGGWLSCHWAHTEVKFQEGNSRFRLSGASLFAKRGQDTLHPPTSISTSILNQYSMTRKNEIRVFFSKDDDMNEQPRNNTCPLGKVKLLCFLKHTWLL